MTTPHTPPAALDVAAIEARAAAATYAASVLLAAFRSPTSAAMASSECREALASTAVSAADVPTLLAHIRRLTAALADSDARVASAVARDDGAQWRPVDEDTAFAPPFSTIRACRWCGCLVAGGPTACARCADSPTGGV